MDESFSCGCHLNHKSAAEHEAFWDRYKHRRRDRVRKREKNRRPRASLPFAGSYHEYLQSHQWQRKRNAAFAHYGKKCCRCQATTRLQVHHRHYNTLFNEAVTDLEVLCDDCHSSEHGKQPKPLRRYQPFKA